MWCSHCEVKRKEVWKSGTAGSKVGRSGVAKGRGREEFDGEEEEVFSLTSEIEQVVSSWPQPQGAVLLGSFVAKVPGAGVGGTGAAP